jgi:hypothetical protein
MNDDGGEEYIGERQDDEFVPEGEEAEAEGELVWVSEECPPETAAQFWLSVAAYEQAPWTTHFQELVDAGLSFLLPSRWTTGNWRPSCRR